MVRESTSAIVGVWPMNEMSVSSLSLTCARAVPLTEAPITSQFVQRSAMARTSSMYSFLNFSALMMELKSVTTKGVRAIWNMFVPRRAIFCSTYTFAPCTNVITVINVATPIVRPIVVSTARSLCWRSASKLWLRLSERASTLHLHALPLLAYAQYGSSRRKLNRKACVSLAIDLDCSGLNLALGVGARIGEPGRKQNFRQAVASSVRQSNCFDVRGLPALP